VREERTMRWIKRWSGALAALPLVLVAGDASPARADTVTSAAVSVIPPRIDGVLDANEWPTQTFAFTSVDPLRGHIRMSHDRNRLYVQVNVTGDTTNSPGDIVQLWVDVNRDRFVTAGVDLEYQLFGSPPGHLFRATMNQPGQPPTFNDAGNWSSGAAGFGCFFGDGSQTIRFDPYQRTCNEHRVYELALDLSQIGITPGQAVRIGVRAADNATGAQGRIPAGVGRSTFGDLVDVDTEALALRTVPSGAWSFGYADFPIEVTQVTQSPGNTQPLVADKTTFVRVYPRATPLTATNSFTYPAAVLLFGRRPDGTSLPGSPLLVEMSVTRAPSRTRLVDSALYQLPSSWVGAGPVRFFAQTRASNHTFTTLFYELEFRTGYRPTIYHVPVNIGTEASPNLPTSAEMTVQEQSIEAIFPVADVNFVRPGWQAVGVYNGSDKEDVITRLRAYYNSLVAAFSFNVQSGRSTFTLPDQVLGYAELGNGATSDPTWSGGDGRVAAGEPVGSSSQDLVFAHEVNHNLDRATSAATWGRHIGCVADKEGTPDPNWPAASGYGVMEIGFDARAPIGAGSVVPAGENELMGYCVGNGGAQTKWVGPYRWREWAEAFGVVAPSAAAATAAAGGETASSAPDDLDVTDAPFVDEALYVSGEIGRDGSVTLAPVVTLPGPLSDRPVEPDAPYRLELLGGDGAVVDQVPLTAVFDEDPEHGDRTRIGFSLRLQSPAGLSAVRVVRDGVVLAERNLSPSAPTIRIVDPAPGTDVGSGRFTVRVERTDPDGDPVNWSLYVRSATSLSDGRWLPVASELTGDTAVVDTRSMPGGDELLLRVVASDGMRTTVHTHLGDIAAALAPPLLAVQGAADRQRIVEGEVLTYRADATGADGRELRDDEIVWLVDGRPAGLGPELHVAFDRRGRHRIEVVAADSVAGTEARSAWSALVVPGQAVAVGR
jgi:hypothetical protein